jgi:hypothetical protein
MLGTGTTSKQPIIPFRMLLFGLNALWAVPISAFLWARQSARQRLWLITGAAFGAVVSPAAMGLYTLYYIPGYLPDRFLAVSGPVLLPPGMVGLLLALIHGEPGYNLAIWLGFVPPRTVVEGTQHVSIAILDGIVWSLVYGTLGGFIDWAQQKRKNRPRAAA